MRKACSTCLLKSSCQKIRGWTARCTANAVRPLFSFFSLLPARPSPRAKPEQASERIFQIATPISPCLHKGKTGFFGKNNPPKLLAKGDLFDVHFENRHQRDRRTHNDHVTRPAIKKKNQDESSSVSGMLSKRGRRSPFAGTSSIVPILTDSA